MCAGQRQHLVLRGGGPRPPGGEKWARLGEGGRCPAAGRTVPASRKSLGSAVSRSRKWPARPPATSRSRPGNTSMCLARRDLAAEVSFRMSQPEKRAHSGGGGTESGLKRCAPAAARRLPSPRAHALFRNFACDRVSEWSTARTTLAHEPRIGPSTGLAPPPRRRFAAPLARPFTAGLGAASSSDPDVDTVARFRPGIAGRAAKWRLGGSHSTVHVGVCGEQGLEAVCQRLCGGGSAGGPNARRP